MQILSAFLLFWSLVYSCGETYPKNKVPKDFYFSIERTPCRGTCPAYKAEVNAKGKVTYQGVRSVKYIGDWTAKMPKNKLYQFYQLLNSVNFSKYKESYYNPGIADIPKTTIIFQANNKKHKLILHMDQPARLDSLVSKIEKEYLYTLSYKKAKS